MLTSYTPEEIAEHIAREKENDKFAKHVSDKGRKDFTHCGRGGIEAIKTREDYARVIEEAMTHPETECFSGQTWDMYYQRETNLFIYVDRENPEKSTAFPPRQGEKYWQTQQEQENESREGRNFSPLVLYSGGHVVLKSQQEEQKKSIEFDKEVLVKYLSTNEIKQYEKGDITQKLEKKLEAISQFTRDTERRRDGREF